MMRMTKTRMIRGKGFVSPVRLMSFRSQSQQGPLFCFLGWTPEQLPHAMANAPRSFDIVHFHLGLSADLLLVLADLHPDKF